MEHRGWYFFGHLCVVGSYQPVGISQVGNPFQVGRLGTLALSTMGGKIQQLRLCTCKVIGRGSKQHWSPSRLEFTPGQWIPKAMCARHRNIDKSVCYLEGSINESEGVSETLSVGSSSSLGNTWPPDRDDLPSPLTDMDTRSGGDAAMLQAKEETDSVEETLHDLVHLYSAVTQRAMSFPSDLNLNFSRDCVAMGTTYELLSSIPSGPNMGHRRLRGDAPENAAIMAHEHALFDVFISLKHLDKHPSLEASRLQLLALVENEIYRIDSIRQVAWNHSLDGKGSTDITKSGGPSGISVNTGMWRVLLHRVP